MKTFQGTVTTAERLRSHYLYLPFEVPAGATRVSVSYEFDAAGGILDLGLADPRLGPFPSREGFRGWSGSARRSAFVAVDDATPGYIAGPLPPGTWHVILGLARVGPAGCRYRVSVEIEASAPEAGGDAAGTGAAAVAQTTAGAAGAGHASRLLPAGEAREGARWYRGDLQSHTFHSDARGSPADLLRAARDRSLEFLAVTDHNTVSHHRVLAGMADQGILLVPGQEVTTYRGHANVWGDIGWSDFRVTGDTDLDTLVADVHARGGLFSVNHPKATPDCLGCDWEYAVPAGADAFEAWQGPWPARNWESLARYDEQLRTGRRITLVGGSDRHQPGYPDPDPEFLQIGSPTTWLWLEEASVAGVLAAIRSGRAFVSESPAGPQLEISVAGEAMGQTVSVPGAGEIRVTALVGGARGDRLRWIGHEGVLREVAIDSDEFTDEWDWRAAGPFIRAEVVADAALPHLLTLLESHATPEQTAPAREHPWRRALSNPVYLQAVRS